MPAAFDLDAYLGPLDTGRTTTIDFLGRKWTLNCSYNSFALNAILGGDTRGLDAFLQSLVVGDEWADFKEALFAQQNFPPERMAQMLNGLIEAVGERPTSPSSDSGSTATKRTSKPRSGDGSSAVRAVR